MSNTAPFLHIAYANNDTGTLDFTTTGGIERTYTGFYTDEYATDSSDPTKYKWLTNAEFKNKVNTHIAYSDSSDGVTSFTTNYPNLNLLDGSKDFSGTWANSDSWTNDGTYKGLTVKKRIGQWAYIFKTFIVPKDGTYTFSAYVKSSGNTANIIRYGAVNSQESQIIKKSIGNNFDWTRDSITLNLKANDKVWVSYAIAVTGTDSILWTAGHKWEESSTATPYMPSASEVTNSNYPAFMGVYYDYSTTASSDPTKYKWLSNAEFKSKVSTAAYAKSADGKDGFTTVYPNLNLLDGTKDFSGTWSGLIGWITDGTYKGLTVKKHTLQWRGVFKTFTAPKDGTYTFSACLKASGNATKVYRYGMINGVASYSKLIGTQFDWIFDSTTVTLNSGQTASFRYEMAVVDSDSILWTAGHKWEEGSAATTWMPSITEVKDSDYPQYIGLSNVINPTTFKDYEWTLLESIPKKILNTHVAYANSSDGITDFTTTYPNLNLLLGSSAKTKDGFFKNFDKVENDYGELTLSGTNNYDYRSVWDGFSIKPRDYKPGDKYTISMDVMFTSWNFPAGTSIGEFWIGQRYTANADGTILAWYQTCFIDLPKDPSQMLNKWIRITQTTTIPPHPDPAVKSDAYFMCKFLGTSEASFTIRVRKPKQELGSIATPWMPSITEVQPSDYPKFVGVYGDDSTTASQSPTAYNWSSIPVPGPTPPVVDNLYVLTMPTVKSINLTYGIGTLTTKPTSWLSAKPKLDANQVLWYKSEITGTDNSVATYYSNLVGGSNLDDGDSPLDNTVVSIVLNNKTVNVPRDLALKLELLSQTLNKRDDSLAQRIADTNDRITNIDMGSGQAGLNQEVLDRKNGDDALGGRIDTVTGNVNDLTTTTQTKFTNIEKQLGGFSVQGTKNSSLTRPSIVFNYNAYGATLPDGSSDGGGRLYYQVPGDTNYDVKELKFNYQTIPSFYDMDQITIWEKSWSTLYGGFNWRDTIITTTDTDTFYIDGMTTYYDHNGDLIIRGKVVMDGIDDWIGSMSNRGFKPDTVVITVASDLNSVKSIRFTGDMGVIEMTMNLGYGATAQVQRLGRRVSFYGSSPIGQFSTTSASWTSLSEKITYGIRPIRGLEFAVNTFGNNNSMQYAFDTNGSIKVHQSVNNANQYQVMGQVGWQTFDQYPPSNYTTYSAWTNR